MKLNSNISKTVLFVLGTAGIIIGIILTVVFIYSDMTNQKNDSVTKIYYVDNISSAHQKLINIFNGKNKNKIEVVPINVPFDKFSTNERKELLIRYLRSKNDRIDLFAVDQIWVPRFARWSEPLGKYFPTSEREKLLSYALETCVYNENLMALPLYIDVATMYYRKNILNSIPENEVLKNKLAKSITWEELIELGKKNKKFQNIFYIFPADKYEGLMCSFVELIQSQGGNLFYNDSLNLRSPEAKRSLQFLIDLVNKYKFTPEIVTEYNENLCYEYFLKNDALFLRHWPDFLNDNEAKLAKYSIDDEVVPVPLPHFEGSKKAAIFGGWNLMISKYSKRKAASLEFLKFLTSREAQELIYKEGGYLPVLNSVYEDTSMIKDHPHLKYFYGLMEMGIHRPFVENYTQYSDIISFYLNLAIKNELTADEALKQAEDVIKNKIAFIK